MKADEAATSEASGNQDANQKLAFVRGYFFHRSAADKAFHDGDGARCTGHSLRADRFARAFMLAGNFSSQDHAVEEIRRIGSKHPALCMWGAPKGDLQLSGNSIVDLMRKHKKTIREIAEQNSITMKRVREVREKGVEGFIAENWLFIITGKWPESVMKSI